MTKVRNALKGGAFALGLMMSIGSANAADFDFGVIPPGQMKAQVSGHSPGSFTDNFTFALTLGGPDGFYSYTNFLVRLNGVTTSNISNPTLTLAGPTSFGPISLTEGVVALALAAGSYTATVTGYAAGTGGGAYEFNITAPTPEPAVWLTMLLGAGIIGFAVRRRKTTVGSGALLAA